MFRKEQNIFEHSSYEHSIFEQATRVKATWLASHKLIQKL